MRALTLIEMGEVSGGVLSPFSKGFDLTTGLEQPWKPSDGGFPDDGTFSIINWQGIIECGNDALFAWALGQIGVNPNGNWANGNWGGGEQGKCKPEVDWLECTTEKAGAIGVVLVIATGLAAARGPAGLPLAAGLGMFTALWWSTAALSCLIHAYGNIPYTKNNPFPG
jgi:hypothetical protein